QRRATSSCDNPKPCVSSRRSSASSIAANDLLCARARTPTTASTRSHAPPLNDGSVPAKPTKGGDPPIAVNQHQPLNIIGLCGARRTPNHNAGDDLSAAGNRARQPLHRLRLKQPCAGKAHFQFELTLAAIAQKPPQARKAHRNR